MGSAGHCFDRASGLAEYQVVFRQLQAGIRHETRRTWADDVKAYAEPAAGIGDRFGRLRSMNRTEKQGGPAGTRGWWEGSFRDELQVNRIEDHGYLGKFEARFAREPFLAEAIDRPPLLHARPFRGAVAFVGGVMAYLDGRDSRKRLTGLDCFAHVMSVDHFWDPRNILEVIRDDDSGGAKGAYVIILPEVADEDRALMSPALKCQCQVLGVDFAPGSPAEACVGDKQSHATERPKAARIDFTSGTRCWA